MDTITIEQQVKMNRVMEEVAGLDTFFHAFLTELRKMIEAMDQKNYLYLSPVLTHLEDADRAIENARVKLREDMEVRLGKILLSSDKGETK